MTIQVTMEKVFEIADALVVEKGAGYKYDFPAGGRQCFNVWEGKPSCIVGTIMHRLGVPVETMGGEYSEVFAGRDAMSITDLARSLETEGVIDFIDNRVIDALRYMQIEQDGGETWADAVAISRRRLSDYYRITV